MCLLLETIKVRNNKLLNLEFHNDRVNYSHEVLFNSFEKWDLSLLISVSHLDPDITYKCRVLYSDNIERIEFLPYTVPKIIKLFMIEDDILEYSFKYADREALNQLKTRTAQETNSDILIVRNGLLTDTSFSNIVFFDGNKWYTPESPLLRGTKRAYYLKNKIIYESRICPSDLNKFKKARLINAMIDLEEGGDILIENIQ